MHDVVTAEPIGNKMHHFSSDSSVYRKSHQWSLQVEGLSVLEEQHDVSLQVTQTAVAMTSNPLLQWRYSTCITLYIRESNKLRVTVNFYKFTPKMILPWSSWSPQACGSVRSTRAALFEMAAGWTPRSADAHWRCRQWHHQHETKHFDQHLKAPHLCGI